MPPTDTGTQYAGLTPAERAAAMIEPHMQACDVLRIADCRYCRARLSTIRQVLAAVAPVIRAQALTEAADALLRYADNYPPGVFPPDSDTRDAVAGTAMRHAYTNAASMVRLAANPSTEESTDVDDH